jgi:hypothetical protein
MAQAECGQLAPRDIELARDPQLLDRGEPALRVVTRDRGAGRVARPVGARAGGAA